MSVIARFRRSLGFSPGGNPSSETCSTSPVRAPQALETGEILNDEGHDKEQHNIFADMPGPSSQSSVAKTSNSSPAGSNGPVLAYFVLESSTGVEKVRYPIRKRVTKIGRLPVNDIRIYRETVSRLHCEVLVEGDIETPGERIIILLVHNTRGVRINAEAVERPADGSSAKQPVSIRLHEGDVLEIYRNFFRVRQPSFHSYSRNTSPIAQRQPLSSLMPSSSRIANSPDRTSQAQKLPSSPAAPAGTSGSPPDLLRSDVPRILKGRRSLFTATPKREIQRSTPWTAEPVKSRALRRIPSGGHEPAAEPDELPTLKPDEESVDKAHATARDRCGEHSGADFFGTEEGAFDEAQGGIAVPEKPAIDQAGSCQDLEESVHERESDQRQEKRRAKTPEAIHSAHEEVGSSQSARPSMRRSQSLSPKKPRRRSTFFGRAGVFANWNFGFYPEERRDQEAAESQVALDEKIEEMPSQPFAFDDGEVARPLTPISMPQPRLDESGRPRLPRSISSPDMRAGSPKKRVVSLRTATLLRAGQQAFEQQKLRSPPASPKRPARRPYRFSYIVAPVVTPDDEDDAAEVDESLSLLEAEDGTKQRHEPEITSDDVLHTSSTAETDEGVLHCRQEAGSTSPATDLPEPSISIAAAEESVIIAELSVHAIDQPLDGVESCEDYQGQAQAADAIDKAFAEASERTEGAVLDVTPVNIEFADEGHRLYQTTFAQDDFALRAQETSAKHERKPRQLMPAKVKARKSRRVSKVLPLPTDMLLPSRDDAADQRAECSVARSAPKEYSQGTDDVAVDATAVSDAKHIQDTASTAVDVAVDVADEDGAAEVRIPHAEVNGHFQVEQHPTESTSHAVVTEELVLAQANTTTSQHEAIEEAPETTKAVPTRKTRARPAKKAALGAITVSSPEKAAAIKDDATSVASTDAASSSPTKCRARAAPKSAMSKAAECKGHEEAAGQRPSVPVGALATEDTGPTKRSTRSTRRTKKQASEDASHDTTEATVELKADAKTEEQAGGSARSRRAPARKAAPKRAAASKPAANDENDPSTVAPVRITRSRAARARA